MRYRSSFEPSFGGLLTPWVKRLLVVNAVVFLLIWTTVLPFAWAVEFLAFKPGDLLEKPWTVITYMFVHGGFWHLFFNLLAIFFFGRPLEEHWGSSEFIRYYLVCGAGGVLFSFFLGNHTVFGASAAAYGLLLAFALNWPNAPIYVWFILPVKAKYLALFLGLADLLAGLAGRPDGIAHFAHVGGLVAGFLYLRRPWRAALGSRGLRRRLRRQKLIPIPGRESEASSSSQADSGRRRSDLDRDLWDEVDRVLDKIAASGIESLTQEERHFLDEISKRYREK